MKNLLSVILIALLTSCFAEHSPLSPFLGTVVDSFIAKHPSYDVIDIRVSQLAGHDLLFIIGNAAYDPDMIDGYIIYKDRLLTYYQTDSLDRSSLIDTECMLKYKDSIGNYKNGVLIDIICEPVSESYEIKDKNNLQLIKDTKELKYNRKRTSESNVIKNKELNEFINSYIYNSINVLYELRFCVKDNKQYALFRSMNVYDSDRYDGYFYRNGCLIVLYGADKAKNVLDNTWIKKGKYGIPNTRNIHMNEKLWTFPYPKAFEILPNGHLRELSHEEAFINVL